MQIVSHKSKIYFFISTFHILSRIHKQTILMKVNKLQILRVALLFILAAGFKNLHSQNSLDFDGTDDRVDCGTDTSVTIKGVKITLEAWIYPTAWKTNVYEGNIINKENNTNNNGYMLRCGASGKLNFGFGDNTSTWKEITSANAVLTLNTWQHVAASYDGVKSRLYVNGICTDSIAYTSTMMSSNTVNLTIGDHSGQYQRRFQGRIDDVRIWAVARTTAQIKNNMNNEFCSKQNGLRAYYKFNQGKATLINTSVKTLIDYSGYANNGTLQNLALTGTGSNWVQGVTLSKSITYKNDTLTKCDLYYTPSGKKVTLSGTYYDTIPTYFGCDSVIKTILTIKKRTYKTISAWACSSYTSPSKAYVWTKSGKYTDYLRNWVNCDSVITVNLKIGGTPDSITVSQCYSYTSPSKKYTYTNSGTYMDTVTDYRGCDSIITIFLNILKPTTSEITATACRSYTLPSGKIVSKTGIYYDTIVNYNGCDSIIKVNFKNLTGYKTLTVSACEFFKSPNKKKIWTNSGTYYDTLRNYAFCDSIITVNLTINKAKRTTDYDTACRYFKMVGSDRYVYSSGIYLDTLKSLETGCDSIISRNVNVINHDKFIIHNGSLLTARLTGATYQWINCTRGNKLMDTATNRSFVAKTNEEYGVILTKDGCTDTSDCVLVTNASTKNANILRFSVKPNPNKGVFTIESNQKDLVKLQIFDLTGKLVYSVQNIEIDQHSVKLDIQPGIYQIKITDTNNQPFTQKILIE